MCCIYIFAQCILLSLLSTLLAAFLDTKFSQLRSFCLFLAGFLFLCNIWSVFYSCWWLNLSFGGVFFCSASSSFYLPGCQTSVWEMRDGCALVQYLHLREQAWMVTASLWYTLHIKVAHTRTHSHSLMGKCKRQPPGLSKNKQTCTIAQSVSSLSIITMQTERQCYCIQFHVCLYVPTLDDIETEHADL